MSYALFVTTSPGVAGALDTSDMTWECLCETKKEGDARLIVQSLTQAQHRPWARWRLFYHTGRSAIGRQVAEGQFTTTPEEA